MKLGCAFAGHEAAAEEIYNSGYWFGACRHCGEPLIRGARESWRPVPRGHRVVWKRGRHSHSLAADFDGLLPIVQHRLQLPAPRSAFVSWCRALVPPPLAAAPAAAWSEADERHEEEGFRYPALLVAAVLLGAGLRALLGLAAGR